jgi:hypothetical protein
VVLILHLPQPRCLHRLSDAFEEKIQRIWDGLQDGELQDDETHVRHVVSAALVPAHPALQSFAPASEEEVLKVLKSMSSASCALDPMPTPFVKGHSNTLLPVITSLVNASMSSGHVPQSMKAAIVKPRIKKQGMDADDMNSYRPISNLSFISKVLEKLVAVRANAHMTEHNLYEEHQSAYKIGCSTETALVKVKADILRAFDKREGVLMVMLDLSAAFDTVCHQKLLEVLKARIGLEGRCLDWFKSYLSDRSQTVSFREEAACECPVSRGVPQGSVLGPMLFTIYTLALGDIARAHGVSVHFYADDTQLYSSFSISDDTSVAVDAIEACVASVREWMRHNCLRLNDTKTEVICFSTKQSRFDPSELEITVGQALIAPTPRVKNLGVMFDEHLAMNDFVIQTCRACYLHLRDIAAISNALSRPAREQLVHSLISSRLDYCNVLLAGAPAYLLKKLQRVQNMAARVVLRSSKWSSATANLKQLHWLPVRERIQFKTLLLAYKALHGMGPTYLTEMLTWHQPARVLRSAECPALEVPGSRTEYGQKAWGVQAAVLWNALPRGVCEAETVTSFKKLLKTHLFLTAFNECD